MKCSSNLAKKVDAFEADRTKIITTFILSIVALLLYVNNPSRIKGLCIEAVVLTGIGNLIHLNYKNVPALIFKESRFYVGLACLGIGHILHRACFVKILGYSFLPLNANSVGGIVSILIYCIAVLIAIYLGSKESNVSIIVSYLYVTLGFFNMNAIYTCGSVLVGKYILASIGITMVLAFEVLMMVKKATQFEEKLMKWAWLMYPVGQLLIIVCA